MPSAIALIGSASLPVAAEAIRVDLPIMIMAMVACMPIFLSGHRISRLEGGLFLFYYWVYVMLLYVRGSSESILGEYKTELVLVALPVLVTTTAAVMVRALRDRKQSLMGGRV